jgi:hypothetical protein
MDHPWLGAPKKTTSRIVDDEIRSALGWLVLSGWVKMTH